MDPDNAASGRAFRPDQFSAWPQQDGDAGSVSLLERASPFTGPSVDFLSGALPSLDIDIGNGLNGLSDGVAPNSSLMNHDAQNAPALSDTSHGSTDSVASASSRIRRRRRGRRPPSPRPGVSHRPLQKEHRRYQCTFCTDTFKTKHDWQRHERALHLSLEQWHCSPFGASETAADGALHCAFCGLVDPAPEHAEEHNFAACSSRPPTERIFRRKDHLQQHLRLVHNGIKFNERMQSWLTTIDEVHSRCGFCDARMTSWSERDKHLAHHFRHGAHMIDWKGDQGFDREIESLVQDDMPAFLIGQQRRTTEPFSATVGNHRSGFWNPDAGAASNALLQMDLQGHDTPNGPSETPTEVNYHSHRDIERQLLTYVSDEIRQGRVPSDRQLQKKCGVLMCGDDYDGWEQTWAEHAQWLDRFRKRAGLISLPLTGGKNAFVGQDVL